MQEYERLGASMDETAHDPVAYDKLRPFFDSSATLH
jgi:hypothetical protein